MANSLIRNNGDRAVRSLEVFEGNPQGSVRIVQYPTIETEAAGLATSISDYVAEQQEKGHPIGLDEILVLTPRTYSSVLIKNALQAQGISAFNYYDDKLLRTKSAQKAITLLTLLAQPDDAVALRCWLGMDRDDRAANFYGNLRELAAEQEIGIPQALERLATSGRKERWVEVLTDKFHELQELRESGEGVTGTRLIDFVFPEDDVDLEDLRRLALLCVPEIDKEITAEALLEDIKIRLLQNEPPPVGSYVRIMSAHKSKGLTARLVVVASCMEGWLPSFPDDATAEEELKHEREQRRLFYVAITRCTEAMILSSFVHMPVSHAHRSRLVPRGKGRNAATGLASRFLNELGPDAPQPEAGV